MVGLSVLRKCRRERRPWWWPTQQPSWPWWPGWFRMLQQEWCGHSGGGGSCNFLQGVFCQLCSKEGHMVNRCFKRFDTNFTGPPQKTASSATTSSYGVDTNWYMDTGATDHITGELEKLNIHEKYTGNDQVHAANGAGMGISHIGHSILHSQNSRIDLNKILHVPQGNKSLVSIHRLADDNNVFLEFHPKHFFIKEQGTRRTLLEGRCEGGLYRLRSSLSNKKGLGGFKPSVSLWHSHLGHASNSTI